MTCKDCVHYEVCCYENGYDEVERRNTDDCELFKDKSKVIELPCKVGDTVYLKVIGFAEILKGDVRKMSLNRKGELVICIGRKQGNYYTSGNYKISSFGKTVFLTREEAEEALKKREEGTMKIE